MITSKECKHKNKIFESITIEEPIKKNDWKWEEIDYIVTYCADCGELLNKVKKYE